MRDCIPEEEEKFLDLFKEYFDAEKFVKKQHDPATYTLARMYPLAAAAGNPERKLKIIHIAGTKGKGTTTQFTDALLRCCGIRSGFFASPHVSTYRERFQVNGTFLSYGRMYQAGQDMVRLLHEAKLTPSLFELFTVLALKLFVEEGVETAVLETGIGGRLDATNYVSNPIMTLITPISFDHMALLGNTIEQIAAEKAGIMQQGVPVVMLKQPYKEAEAVIRRHADELGCPLLQPVPIEDARPFLPDALPDFLQDNFCGALAAIRALGLDPKPENFKMPQLRARFDKISNNPLVLLDGAHNGDSMEKLVSALRKLYPGTKWNVVLGCVEGKDINAIVAALSKLEGASFILTNPRTFKGSALPQLQEAMKGLPVLSVIPHLTSREQLPEGPLLFTGSFFTTVIGEDIFN